jgi:hypothetical protein
MMIFSCEQAVVHGQLSDVGQSLGSYDVHYSGRLLPRRVK